MSVCCICSTRTITVLVFMLHSGHVLISVKPSDIVLVVIMSKHTLASKIFKCYIIQHTVFESAADTCGQIYDCSDCLLNRTLTNIRASTFPQYFTVNPQKKNVSHGQQGPLRGSSSPYGALSQRGLLDPIKLAYDQRRPAQINSQRR